MSTLGSQRRFGLVQATALNMINMIGIGPFITIPLLLTALGGPQAMLGWAIALLIVICDGMVWSELGAAMPGPGGSFGYLREAFGRETFGRLMAFLFVWQFILSGPLEIASGYIGFAQYLGYIWHGLSASTVFLVAAAVGILNVVLLYRRITSIATITVSLWVGTLLTTIAVVVTGALHFDPKVAFDFPPNAFTFSLGFLIGLGAASRIGVYDYLGYYDVCYIADEVDRPGYVIPRSILISTLAVALIYVGINLSIIGVVPWREWVPADQHPSANFIVSVFMEKVYGSTAATIFTLMILWTAFGSVFALLLGYSRIPYAAAIDGYFFKAFGRLHPTKGFPYVSLLVLGAISILACLFSLGVVIDALIATRILVQFIGQVAGVIRLRRTRPDMPRPYRIWLYPVPTVIALLGWIFIFVTTDVRVIGFGLAILALGVGGFLVWSRRLRQWPFRSVAALLLLSLLAGRPLAAQTKATAQNVPEIPYRSVPNFLKLPPSIYLGEGIGVATNSRGHVFVYTRSSETRLFEFDRNGVFLREIGRGLYGFAFAHAVRVDRDDNVWTVDEGTNMVIKFNAAGRVVMVLGRRPEAVEGLAAAAPNAPVPPPEPYVFSRPTDVGWDADGNIFVTDGYGNSRVVKFDRNGRFLKQAGTRGSRPGQLNLPHTMAMDAEGNVYVGDRSNARVEVFDNDLNVKAIYDNVGNPWAVCISPGPHQYLFVSNSIPDNGLAQYRDITGEIYKMELDGTIVGRFGKPGKQLNEFSTVHEIDCRNPNELLVAEITAWRVQKIILGAQGGAPAAR